MLTALIELLPSTTPSDLGVSEEPSIILCLVQSINESARIRTQIQSLMKEKFSCFDQFRCQTIPAFLKAHLKSALNKNIQLSGFNNFKQWCAITENKSLSTQKKNQKKSLNFFRDVLKETCKIPYDRETSEDLQEHLYYYLYLELQMLAPFNGYADEKVIRITKDQSFFNPHEDIIIEEKIEKILRDYRSWLSKEGFIDPSISDLSTLSCEKLKWFNGLRLTHIVWSANEDLSSHSQMLDHLKEMAPTIIIHSPGKKLQVVDSKWEKSYALQQLQTASWLSKTHNEIPDLYELEVKEMTQVMFNFLLQQRETYVKAFAKKIIHHERCEIFSALIETADLNDLNIVAIIEILLECLKMTILEDFPPKFFSNATQYQDERSNFYLCQKEIFGTLLNIKHKTKDNTQLKSLDERLFRLPFFLFHAISTYTVNSCQLYYLMLKILENSTIESTEDLMSFSCFLTEIHQHNLMKTRLPEDSNYKNTVATWKIMRKIYLIAINICLKITAFSSAFKTAINFYALVTEHRQKFSYDNPDIIHWHAETYQSTCMTFVNELELAEKKQCFVAENFFDQIFAFAENNPIQKTWDDKDKQKILQVLVDFLKKSASYNFKSIREKLEPAFSWKKMKQLFNKDAFNLSGQAIQKIFRDIDAIFSVAHTLALSENNTEPKTYEAWCRLLSNNSKTAESKPTTTPNPG